MCGKYMMDEEEAMELRSEIEASSASLEGRFSDLNNLNLCDPCLRRQLQERR